MNVLDHLKNNSPEENKALYDKNACQAAVTIFHLNGDFNMSNIVRSANFFGFKEALYVGKKRWDRRGAVGVHNYINLKYFSDEYEWFDYVKDSYKVVCLENNTSFNPQKLPQFSWPINPMIVAGEEGPGIPEEIIARYADYCVEVPAFGTVRSMNVASAASIAMYDYRAKLS